MPCYHPIRGYRTPEGGITLNPKKGFKGISGKHVKLDIPCGQCRGCRLERSRMWAVRIVHEAANFDVSSFVTLTYDDSHLPVNNSINKLHIQLFLKRLRKYLSTKNKKIRYYCCGEYGDKKARPHYHLIIFGYWPSDAKYHTTTSAGHKLYISNELALHWPYGYNLFGELTFESAAYTARYVLKKINGDLASEHYESITPEGEVFDRLPEFVNMSRRPGIASGWYDIYKRDLEKDFLTMRGTKMRPPRFFDKLLHRDDPDAHAALKESRKVKALQAAPDNTPARLSAKRQIKERKLKILKRGYETNEN